MQYEEFVLLRSFSGDKSCKTTDAFNLGKLYFKRGEYSPALYFFPLPQKHLLTFFYHMNVS